MSTWKRLGLWLGSLLVSVTVFSLLCSGPGSFQNGTSLLVFRITIIFAFPVWCLSLPCILPFQDAEGWRSRIILLIGTFIGPASIALWGLILQLRGDDPHQIWQGRPVNIILFMNFALMVGLLATTFYVATLKFLHHRSAIRKTKLSKAGN